MKLNKNVLSLLNSKQPERMKSDIHKKEFLINKSFKIEREDFVSPGPIKKFNSHHNSTIAHQKKSQKQDYHIENVN